MVYVLSKNGQPLMPTERHGKVRRLLRDGKAKVVKRCPFTIRLLYESGTEVQPVSLGVDAGSRVIGLSAATEDRVLYEGEVELRRDIPDLLSTRRECRRGRRYRKTRYRKPRFRNRVRSKNKGWLAPSVENRIRTHMKAVAAVCRILPVSRIVVETAAFDIQKIRNPEIEGTGYQQGDQLGFWNVREYVLFRDGHTCRCCRGKSKDPILNVHHIESRKTGGDAPNNLITLCETCHTGCHQGTMQLPETIKRGMSFRDQAFMGIMRWAFYKRLKEEHPDVSMTFGYITKNTRIQNGLEKSHRVDARCISGNPLAKPPDCYYYSKAVRRHNRQIHKMSIPKGGKRKLNQAPKRMFGYQLHDRVRFGSQDCFIFGRRSSGYFDIRMLDGTKLSAGVSYKRLKLLETRTTILTERRKAG